VSAIFLTADLVFSSRVTSLARQLGRTLAIAPTPQALLAKCSAEAVSLVLIDLSLPKLNTSELVLQLRALPSPPSAVVAYAPHVHENLLSAARDAGCTEVLTRGQFNDQIEQVLKEYVPEQS
jgi:CheY-like chemotaxis protein